MPRADSQRHGPEGGFEEISAKPVFGIVSELCRPTGSYRTRTKNIIG